MKKYLVVAIFIFLLYPKVSFAKNEFVNNNGIYLSEEEIIYLDKMFYDTYKNNLTQEEYNQIFVNGVPDIDSIEKKEYIQYNILRDVSHSTTNKKITLSKSYNGINWRFAIVANWFKDPKVRSHDVIGARFSVSTSATEVLTKLESSKRSTSYNNLVKNSSGVGCSVLLNDNDSNIIVSQSFTIPINTRVTASYQHAKSPVSLADSMNYSFSANGLGGVFLFNNSIGSKYDGMLGVYLD